MRLLWGCACCVPEGCDCSCTTCTCGVSPVGPVVVVLNGTGQVAYGTAFRPRLQHTLAGPAGTEEGGFAWLTLNYLLGHLGKKADDTVAAIDLVGAAPAASCLLRSSDHGAASHHPCSCIQSCKSDVLPWRVGCCKLRGAKAFPVGTAAGGE